MKHDQKAEYAGVQTTLALLAGKYSSSVLCLLASHKECARFNELKHMLGDIPCKTLSSTLKKMEEDKLLLRTEYPQIPPRVEYRLTEKGKSLLPVLQMMESWGLSHR